MSAVLAKVGLVAVAGLVLLVPAFNSLNQVTVEDVKPPVTLDDPPQNLPPPKEGDEQIEGDPQEAPRPESPECPPPKLDKVYEWSFDRPGQLLATGGAGRFAISPGSAGLAYVGNLTNFIGTISITLTDPEGSSRVVYSYDSANADPESGAAGGTRTIGPADVKGAVPGEWQVRIDLSPLAVGHADVQMYQLFPCGGVGQEVPQ